MNIYLGEHFEQFIRDQIATGRYANASEVVREALLQYEDNETRLANLRAAIQVGMDELKAGRAIPWTPELMESIIQEAHVRAGLADLRAGRVTRVDDIHAFLDAIRERNRQAIAALKDQESISAAS